jgi:flagellar hook assembly protein FlgD
MSQLAFLLCPIPAVCQSSFTVFTNAPPVSNGIDTSLAGFIDSATTSISATIYSLERQVVRDALLNARSRGVNVRLVAEDDNYNSESYGPSFQALSAAGIPIVTDTAGGAGSGTMHDKFYVFDGTKVWTGSYNPTNNGTVADSNNAILIDNASLAQTYTDEFNEMFTSHHFGTQKANNTTHSFTIDGYEVESHFSPSDGVRFQMQSEIAAAAHSVYFLVFSFTDDDIRNSLIAKHQSEVIVRGAFDNALKNQSGGEYLQLKNVGIPVRVDDYAGALHHKLMIIDPGYSSCAVITGSCNWSSSAFSRNDEDIVIIRHPDVVNQYYGIFEDIYRNHCVDEGGDPVGAIVISEIMSKGDQEDIQAGDRGNWGESKEEGGSPNQQGEPDTLPPVIIHTPVERVLAARPIYIHCEIYDPDDPDMYSAKEPTVFYRRKAPGYSFQSAALGALYGKYTGTIPASAVTVDGVEYFLSARDWSYNLATSPSFNPQSNAYQIAVVDDPDAVIRFTEIMYDPPQDVEDETVYEWVEIFNTNNSSSVNLSSWQFTDGEGTYVFPTGSSIGAQERQILCKTSSGPSGGQTRYIYGPDSVGDINLNNPLGVVTDQLILKDETGLIVEEVDYSANWGASNLGGPNNHTLEKIDPLGPDDETNWMYSMVEGGTPWQASSPHFIFHTYYSQVEGNKTLPGIRINPTIVAPGLDETCKIQYVLNHDCTVSVLIYGPPTDPQDYFSNLVRTLVNNASQTSGTTYEIDWDGKDSIQDPVYGICRAVVEATYNGQTSRASADDTIPQLAYRGFDPENFDLMSHELVKLEYYQSKPELIDISIRKNVDGQYQHIRTLYAGALMPRSNDIEKVSKAVWDGRDDGGRYVDSSGNYGAELGGEDIFGNVIIVREPLTIEAKAVPRSYFNPSGQTQNIRYLLSSEALVSIYIKDKAGNVVATLVDNQFRSTQEQTATWDGTGNTGPGQYTFTIQATAEGRTVAYSGKIALRND